MSTVHPLLIEARPDLAAEYDADNEVPVQQITCSSGRKVNWTCSKCSHSWPAAVHSRVRSTAASRGCPACGGKVVTPATSLLLNYPTIAAAYHPTKNTRPVAEVTSRTSTKCWWQCTVDPEHEWQTSPLNRVKQGDGCPYCGGRFATAEWNLGVIYPEVAAEFDFEANYPLTPRDFTPKSSRKCWWKCNADHRWFVPPLGRIKNDGSVIECGKCGRHSPSPETSIVVTHPDLAGEYDHEKNEVSVEEVLSGSTIKRSWKCKVANHSWDATPASRTRKDRPGNCPECSPTPRTSKTEEQLREAVRRGGVIIGISRQYNTFLPVPSGKHKTMQVDICGTYSETPVVIEWDSWWWHSGRASKQDYSIPAERDLRKTRALLDAGYLVVRFREERNDEALPLLDLQDSNLLQLRYNYLQDGPEFELALADIYAWLTSRMPLVLG